MSGHRPALGERGGRHKPERELTTKEMQRDETLQHLNAMLEEIVQARGLTATGQAISALQALLRARRLGRQAIAVLLGDCLSTTATQADPASLSRLVELIGFAQQALCPGCRIEAGKRWKEANNVSIERMDALS